MKVLVFSQYFWPENFIINSLVGRLVEVGHDVNVLTGQPNYPQGVVYEGYRAGEISTESYKGAMVHRIPVLPRGTGKVRLALNYLSFIFSGALFGAWVLRKQKFEVILVYAPSPLLQALPAIFLGWLRRKPVVLWVQDLWPESLSATGFIRSPVVLKGIATVVRYIYSHSNLILAASVAFMDPIRRLAPDARICYLPNSIDDSFSQRVAERTAVDSGFTIVFAGNLGAAQALDCILDAAEILLTHPEVRFELIGDGSQMAWLRCEVSRRGLFNVSLPGRRPVEEMPGLMQAASALLVSLRAEAIFEYTVPSKIQAYMASGRPIVASLNGEGARIVREAGAGLTVPAEDSAALARAILELNALPAEGRAAMGAAAYAYYLKHYCEANVAESLLGYLKQVTDQQRETL